jgi:hypothetical protein
MCCSPGSDCFEWIKVLAPTAVAFIFGGIAARITWKQGEVAEAKLKLDLFERRYAIFEKVWGITSEIFKYGPNLSRGNGLRLFGTPFNDIKPEASFLFGKEIDAYISELATKWSEYRAQVQLNDDDPRKSAEREQAIQMYFLEQANDGHVKARFAPFLDLANWK